MTYYPPDTESGKHNFILQETLIQKKKKREKECPNMIFSSKLISLLSGR